MYKRLYQDGIDKSSNLESELTKLKTEHTASLDTLNKLESAYDDLQL